MKLLLLLLCVSSALTALAMSVEAGPSDKFKITTKKANDSVTTQADKDKVTFAIKSPFGISQAVIERQEEQWPKAVVLRLHLKGLENFKLANGTVRLEGAASVQNGATKLRLWKDGQENTPLDAKSPFWITASVKDGYFELPLPAAFLEGNPKTITVNWIDFYRQ